jgi:hypothetical protein
VNDLNQLWPALGGVLARSVLVQERYRETELLATRGLKIAEATMHRNHMLLTHGTGVLAAAHAGRKRYAIAEALCRKALAIVVGAIGEDGVRTAILLTFFAKVRSIMERGSPQESVFRVMTLSTYADVMRHKGQKRRAEELDKAAKAIAESAKTDLQVRTVDITDLK